MGKKLILCIDDEKTVLDSLKVQLREELGNNFHLEFAEGAEEGLEIIEEYTEDEIDTVLVVSDWLMPGIKGDEFLIRVHEKYPRVVKMLLTGQADSDAIERAKKEANLFKCLAKPWDKEELFDTLKEAISKF